MENRLRGMSLAKGGSIKIINKTWEIESNQR